MEVPVYVVRDNFGQTLAICVVQTDAFKLANEFTGRTIRKGVLTGLAIDEENADFYRNPK